MKKVTLESIGKELGISKVAVFKALNDKAGISDDVRRQAKSLADKLGYKRPVSHYKTKLDFLFFINKDFFLSTGEQFYTEIYYYLNAECESIESKLNIVFGENKSADALRVYLGNSKNVMPSGVFIAGEIEPQGFEYLQTVNIPVVFIDYYSPLYKFDYVHVDNYHLSYFAANYLISKGHKQIGFVGNVDSTSSILDRYLGYTKAMIEKGLGPQKEHHINVNIEKVNDFDNILPSRIPTAYICHCDSAAHKLYLLLKIRNLTVPDDVSIISFDNTEICKTLTPALTSIGVSKEKYAKKAIEAMMNIINKTSKTSNNILRPSITERSSVKVIN